MKTLIGAFAILVFTVSLAHAGQTLKAGSIVCLSANYANQAYDAYGRDERAWKYLKDQGLCVVTPEDVPVTVLAQVEAVVKVRAYPSSGDPVEVWTLAGQGWIK